MQSFRTKFKAIPPTPLVRQAPADNQDFIAFVSARDGFRAYVHRVVLDYIKGEAARAAPDETIGLLAGRVCYDPGTGPYTLVLDADGAHGDEAEASPGYVRITAAGQARVRARLERTHPDREIVGWYHSHPKYEARFSSVDETEQETWNDPGHLGIVYSGVDRAEPFGLYRGPRADRLIQQRSSPAPPPPRPEEFSPSDRPSASQATHAYTPPTQAQGTRSVALLPWALMLALTFLTLSIFWLGLRVLAVEGKLDKYARDRQSATAAAPPPRVEPPTATPQPPALDAAGQTEPLVEAGPSLRSPAKTLSPERAPDRVESPRETKKAEARATPEARARAERAAQARKKAAAAAARAKKAPQPSGTKKSDATQGQQPAAKGQGEEPKTNNKPPKQL